MFKPTVIERKFETFKDDLRDVPADVVAKTLDEKLTAGAEELLSSLTDQKSSSARRLQAMFNLVLVSMAKEEITQPLDQISNPFMPPGWLKIVQDELTGLIDNNPEARDELSNTVFFDPNQQQVNRLDLIVSAAVEPAGYYDDESFAAGVALGRIVATPTL